MPKDATTRNRHNNEQVRLISAGRCCELGRALHIVESAASKSPVLVKGTQTLASLESRAHVDALLPSAAELGRAIARLAEEDALSIPLLSERHRRALLAESETLPYRPARPVVGAPERQVLQDFEICMPIPTDGLLGQCAEDLTDLTLQTLQTLPDNLCPEAFRYNDLVMQRYHTGSQGITAHRDHVRYEGIVSLIILEGDATFEVCQDRSGNKGREIPSPPGSIVLMRGYRFAGLQDRPFHLLRDIRGPRVSFGLRFDTQPGTPPG